MASLFERMHVINKFVKRNSTLEMAGEQLIVCVCGFTDGFRKFPEGDIAKVLGDHSRECPLR